MRERDLKKKNILSEISIEKKSKKRPAREKHSKNMKNYSSRYARISILKNPTRESL